MAHEYDLIVIGAGTGGYVAAIRAAQLGLKVAVVEKQKALGGTCLLWGCIPTKALLEHAHAVKIASRRRNGAITFGPRPAPRDIGIDMAQVQSRKDRIVGGLTKGVEFLFKKNKIDWIKGTARLTGNGGVDVFEGDAQTLRAAQGNHRRHRVVPARRPWRRDRPRSESSRATRRSHCARSRERSPSWAAARSAWSSPRSSAASAARSRILELLPRLVPVEDDAVSAELEKSFRKQGITSHTGAKVTAATAKGDGVDIDAQLADGTSQSIRADYLLVATGRGPVTAGLDVERLGVQLEKGYIKVDAQYRTNVPGISAIGDVMTLGRQGTRSWLTYRRPKASSPPNASPGRRRGRSTTSTSRAAPTAIRKSAASV